MSLKDSISSKDAGRNYYEAFLRVIAADKEIRAWTAPGNEIWYRPGQLLVAPRDVDRVGRRLQERQYQFRRAEGFGGVVRLVLNADVEIPRVVAELRDPSQWGLEERVPVIAPHHVTVGFPWVMGNPHVPPTPTAALPDPECSGAGEGVGVGICDTGIGAHAGTEHPRWLGGSYTPEADDVDPAYLRGTVLALEGGHGTFVAGVVRQAAPGAWFDPEVALTPNGIGDEESLTRALSGLSAKVSIVNLSLGCFTLDNLAPLSLYNALATLDSSVVVVAAAGNAGTNRPSWPAAFDNVVAVAAVTVANGVASPADYSSFGPWVDACADGLRQSTYVDGTLELPGAAPLPFNGFARWEGTSFAAPHVAGRLAALMTDSKISAQDAKADLLSTPRWDPDYGVLVP